MSSQEYDKDRTVQHKTRKATPPKIAPPAKTSTSEAEFSDYTSPIENEEGVNVKKYYRNKKYDEDKELECTDDTSNAEMEEGVIDRKYDS